MKLSKKSKIMFIMLVILIMAGSGLFLYAKFTYGAKFKVDFDQIIAKEENDVTVIKQEEEVTYLAKKGSGDYKILAFTDMHLDGMDSGSMQKTIDNFIDAINEEQPHLVIFTGDIVTTIFNKERAVMLADIMEEYGIYWCTILGNHEGEHPLAFSRKNLIELWADDEAYPHCLVELGPEDIYGYGNYVVNLLNQDKEISQSLIFMDSGDYVSKEAVTTKSISEDSYDYIKPDQIYWYQEKIVALPVGTKSSLFVHIPLNEYALGWNEIYDVSTENLTDTEDCTYVSGMQREPVCCSEYNSGFFEIIKSFGSTQAVFCGHDHVNEYSIIYQGIELNYLQASGYSTYGWNDATKAKTLILEEQCMQGYSVITMNADGEYLITRQRYLDK